MKKGKTKWLTLVAAVVAAAATVLVPELAPVAAAVSEVLAGPQVVGL